MSASLLSRPVRVWTFGGCLLLSQAAGLVAADLVLQRVTLTSDLSTPYHESVRFSPVIQVETVSQDPIEGLEKSSKSENDGSTVVYRVSNESTTLLASLSKIEIIDGIGFHNSGAQGKVLIAVSNAKLPATSPQWHQLMQQDLSPGVVMIKVAPTEAKYIKLTFKVTKTGRVADFGIYPISLVSNFGMPQEAKSAGRAQINYNFGDICPRARAIYVSSGDDLKLANNMIDGRPATSYGFAANDIRPTAIIDLGQDTRLGRISSIFSPAKSTVDVYVLKTLPRDATSITPNEANTLHISETLLGQLKPVGSTINNDTGVAIDFPATTARYIILKWNPTTDRGTPFCVAEIAAFRNSGAQSTTLTVANISLTETDGKSASDGKDVAISDSKDVTMDQKDFKECCNEPEPPAEGPPPPAEPPPSIITIPFVSP